MHRGWRFVLGALSPAGARARLMIFPYHRVVAAPDPLSPTSPTAERFERHLRWVSAYCSPLPLSEAVERLSAGTLPARAVALTFDDGYENNLSIAAPLLARYGVPATVFVAADAVERGIMWNDLVIEAVRAAPGTMDAGCCGEGTMEVDETNRLEVSRRLIRSIQYLAPGERLRAAQALYAGVTGEASPERQMLEPGQLRELPGFGIELGAHTINHPILKSLDRDQARREIEMSREWLADVTGTRPDLFAYPNGKRGYDYDDSHMEIARAAGFRAAVAANWGCATRQSSLFELPRFKPWEDTETGFASRLCKTVARTYV